jgi:hypothetical protein
MSSGWGGRINYTYSRLKDNQFAESNSYSGTRAEAQNIYDLEAEYAVGLLDVPHKLVFSPIFELPFAILGDWTISSIVAFESGFPWAVDNNSNTLSAYGYRVQRPNLSGADIETSGSRDDRLYYTGASPGVWISAAGFTQPGQFELGTAPRTLEDVRTPDRHNWDFVATKDIRMGGTRRAQIKFEVLNITNRVKAWSGNTNVRFGNAGFGRVGTQRGFMRLTQVMFRYSF